MQPMLETKAVGISGAVSKRSTSPPFSVACVNVSSHPSFLIGRKQKQDVTMAEIRA